LRQHSHRHDKKQDKNSGGWTRPLRPSNNLDLADEMDLEPTWHVRLQKQLKRTAFGAKLTAFNPAVQ